MIPTGNHLHSMESSTHPSPPPTKLRLMCSSGGQIVPRPHDKSLCYIGGETRMVAVDRHITLQDLTNRLSKTLLRSPASSVTSFTLKYQLPSEDLDSLISVTTDEDLENMFDEYERINLKSSSRIRLFVFPANPEPGSSIGLFLENPVKSEDWFLNALNGTKSGCSDTSSVNCLLDLDDHEVGLPEKKDVSHKVTVCTNVGNNCSGQDVHSVCDSLMMETTSSFGSASSTPSNGNLPPVRVNVTDPVVGSPVSSAKAIQEQSDPFSPYHQQQKQSTGFDLASMDSILSDLTITDQSSPVSHIQSSCSNNQPTDPATQMPQQQKVNNPAYHQLHQQQPQFIPPPQYIHHHPSTAVPVTSYYHHPPMNQQNVMYYIPTSQPPYNFPFHQPQHADTRSFHATPNNQAAAKTELYRTTSSGAPQLVRVSSGYYATPLLTGQYQQMTSLSHLEAGLQEHNS